MPRNKASQVFILSINYSGKMESSYSSSRKRSHQIEDITYIHTAEKSRLRESTQDHLNRTPARNQYTLSAKKDRTSEAKRAIDEVIDMVADKKRMNQEAIAEIQQVNSEVASNLGSLSHKGKVEQVRKGSEQIKNADFSRDYVATSLFDWRQSNEELQRSQKSQKESEVSQENLNLRSRLNEEIRKNNELYKHISHLQAENSNLRISRVSPAEHSLIEENRALREQIHSLESQQGGSLLTELQKLKQENSYLRSQTIALLQNK